MADEPLTCEEVAKRSLDVFVPMLRQWRQEERPEPSLASEVGQMDAASIIERDLRDLGLYLISSDNRATRIELGALVDCIAALRQYSNGEPAAITAERLEQEFKMAQQKNAGSSFLPPPVAISLPLSLRVARDLDRLGKPAQAQELCKLLVEFLHRIVLQDGNVTGGEIATVTEIEEFLTHMIDTSA